MGLGGGGAPGKVTTHYSYLCLYVSPLAGSEQVGSFCHLLTIPPNPPDTHSFYVPQRAAVQSQHATSLQVSFLTTGCPPMQCRAEHPGAGLGELQPLLSLPEKANADTMD